MSRSVLYSNYLYNITQSNLLSVSALQSGSIVPGFGDIDIADKSITCSTISSPPNTELNVQTNLYCHEHNIRGVVDLTCENVTVTGNLTVMGTSTTLQTQTVHVSDNTILLNSDQTGVPSVGLVSGLEICRGDSPNYKLIFREQDETFAIGSEGDVQPVATRQENPVSQGFTFWNPSTYRLETNSLYTTSTIATKGDVSDCLCQSVSEYVDTAFAARTTDNLSEGSVNRYFTSTRAVQALQGLYEVPLTFGSGLTRTVNSISVHSTQSISKLSNLTSNGFVRTSASDGTLTIDTNSYESPLSFGSGLTRSINSITVDTTQNISKLSNLTANGFVCTNTSNGTLSVDTTSYLPSTTSYEVPLTFGSGVTRSLNTVTVDTTQNIGKLSNLTTNGFVRTSAANGTLTIDTTLYLPSTTLYEVPLTFGSGVTRSSNNVTVDTTLNIGRLSNFTTNGFLRTSAANGTLTIDTSTYESPLTFGTGLTRSSNSVTVDTAQNLSLVYNNTNTSSSQFGMSSSSAVASGGYYRCYGNNFGAVATQRGGCEAVFDTRNSGVGGFTVYGNNGTTLTNYFQVGTTGNVNIPTGTTYNINNTSVLSATALGSGVVSSSLTSVGTITTGTWNGTVLAGQYGGTGVANTNRTITLGGNISTASSFTTSGAFAMTLTATAATNVTLPTIGTLATLAGSETLSNKVIDASQLVNSSVSLGKIASINNNTILGNNGSLGAPKALTVAETRTVLGLGTTDSVTFGTVSAVLGTTNLGRTGNVPLATIGNEAAHSALPIGYSNMLNVVTTAGVMPNTSFNFYFNKMGNRDAAGGWWGLSTDWSVGPLYFGRAASNTVYATWMEVVDTTSTQTLTNKTINASQLVDGSVTLAKLSNIANATILGNNGAGAAAPIALTVTQTRSVLGLGTTDNVTFGTVTANLTGTASNASTVSTTNLGLTSTTASTLSNQGAYANLPIGTATVVNGAANGMPNTTSSYYLNKMSIATSGGGWWGFATEIGSSTAPFVGRAGSAGAYAVWTQLADIATSQTLTNKTLSTGCAVPSSLLSGTIDAARFPALSGDVTTSAGSVSTTIANKAVTLAKMADLTANTVLGNNTASAATPIALTPTQVKSLLAIAQADVSGLTTTSSVTFGNITSSGTLAVTGTSTFSDNVTINMKDLYLRDANHGIGYYGGAKPFAGVDLDGPAVYGFGGGILGTNDFGTQRVSLQWLSSGINFQRFNVQSITTNNAVLATGYNQITTSTAGMTVLMPSITTQGQGVLVYVKNATTNSITLSGNSASFQYDSGRTASALTLQQGDWGMFLSFSSAWVVLQSSLFNSDTMIANNSIMGNNSGASASPIALTGANVRSICGLATTDAPTFNSVTGGNIVVAGTDITLTAGAGANAAMGIKANGTGEIYLNSNVNSISVNNTSNLKGPVELSNTAFNPSSISNQSVVRFNQGSSSTVALPTGTVGRTILVKVDAGSASITLSGSIELANGTIGGSRTLSAGTVLRLVYLTQNVNAWMSF